MNKKIIFHFLFTSNFTFFSFLSPPLEHILTWNLGEVSIPNYVWMVHYGINCILLCSIFIKSKFVLCSIALLADVAGGERTEELPLQSMATHGRSSSLPAMDVAGGERTGGAPPLTAMARGARRDKEAGREGAERCS